VAGTSRVTGSESAITCKYEAFGRRDIPFVRAPLAAGIGRTGTRAGRNPAKERRRRRG
jgi:hypothetical protein